MFANVLLWHFVLSAFTVHWISLLLEEFKCFTGSVIWPRKLDTEASGNGKSGESTSHVALLVFRQFQPRVNIFDRKQCGSQKSYSIKKQCVLNSFDWRLSVNPDSKLNNTKKNELFQSKAFVFKYTEVLVAGRDTGVCSVIKNRIKTEYLFKLGKRRFRFGFARSEIACYLY